MLEEELRELARNGAHVTVIERNLNIANALSGSDIGAHANLDVIHGDFLDRNILTEIGIKEHHIAIAALDDDHISIAAALLANDMGVTRTGLILKDSDLVTVTQRMGITFAVDIKRVADNILAHIHTKASGAYAILSNIPDVVGISQTRSKRFEICWKDRKFRITGLVENCIHTTAKHKRILGDFASSKRKDNR